MLRAVRQFVARTSLRVRLVAAVLVLVVVALAGAGVFTVVTLRGYLIQRMDQQLAIVAAQVAQSPGTSLTIGAPRDSTGDDDHRLPSAFVAEILNPDGTTAATTARPGGEVVARHEQLPAFPSLTAAETSKHAGKPFTVASLDGPGHWRVIAVPVGAGAGSLLVASNLADVQHTVEHLQTLELVVGAITVALIAVGGGLLVGATLRPLRQVEDTAAAIASGDLSRRVPDRDDRTEVGRLGAAINVMLEKIETSFLAQAASEADARQSEEKMRRFVADAGHELRTPLTSIRGFAELYRLHEQDQSTADVTHGIVRIEDAAKRMGLLVEDLLLLARLDQERPLRSDAVDLLQVATEAVHNAHVAAADRLITLEVACSDPPPIVTGDPDRLHQVFANLLSNAVQHTPPTSPIEVLVTTNVGDRDANASIEIVDHGPGLSAEHADQVFERFYRVHGDRNRDSGGAGLGLAIVAGLIGQHGGTVEVTRTSGGGATFRVVLPLAVSPEIPPSQYAAQYTAGPQQAPTNHGGGRLRLGASTDEKRES
jgi:two-component system OmpR family sensor kinase